MVRQLVVNHHANKWSTSKQGIQVNASERLLAVLTGPDK